MGSRDIDLPPFQATGVFGQGRMSWRIRDLVRELRDPEFAVPNQTCRNMQRALISCVVENTPNNYQTLI